MSTNRVILFTCTLLFAATSLGACAAKQIPPAEGQCNAGRQWVPPHQTESGRWVEGFCRDIR